MHPILFYRNFLGVGRRPATQPGPRPEKRSTFLRRWIASALRNWQRRKLIAALEAMDDRLLRDIGIHRGEIANVVDGFSDRELRMAPLAPDAMKETQAQYRNAA
tara:strand:+ start:923 stop:1234 length:312 start_codon:yes stop_codon:yes gene_type:complete